MACDLPGLLASYWRWHRPDAQQPPQNDTDDAPQARAASYAEIVRADQPVAYWRFEDETGLAELNGSPWMPAADWARSKFMQAGPRRQKFPLFDAEQPARFVR